MNRELNALSTAENDGSRSAPFSLRGVPQGKDGSALPIVWFGNPEVVKQIPSHIRPQEHIINTESRDDYGAESFRFLRHRLQRLREQRGLRRVLIASAAPKDGKTVVAVNLAIMLAQGSSRVLLIDGDMRGPRVHTALGVSALPGLAECLDSKLEPSEAIRRVAPFGLFYLAAWKPTPNPAELLEGGRARDLMRTAADQFDWIVVDSPPLNPFADAHSWAGLTDGLLLIVRPGCTPRDLLQQTVAMLDGTFIAGVVMNCQEHRHQHSYRYYYPPRSSRENKEGIHDGEVAGSSEDKG